MATYPVEVANDGDPERDVECPGPSRNNASLTSYTTIFIESYLASADPFPIRYRDPNTS